MVELGGAAGRWLAMVDTGGGWSWSVKHQRRRWLSPGGVAPPVHSGLVGSHRRLVFRLLFSSWSCRKSFRWLHVGAFASLPFSVVLKYVLCLFYLNTKHA
jgi:hypothetical protein